MNQKRIFAVLIGVIIMLVPLFVLPDLSNPNNIVNDFSAFLWIIGGFAAAFMVGKGIKSGILTGFSAGIIAGIITFVLYIHAITFDTADLIASAILFMVMLGLFGIAGGLICGLVNEWRSKTMDGWKWALNFVFAISLLIFLVLTFIPSPSYGLYGAMLFFVSFTVLLLVGLLMVLLKIIKILEGYERKKSNF